MTSSVVRSGSGGFATPHSHDDAYGDAGAYGHRDVNRHADDDAHGDAGAYGHRDANHHPDGDAHSDADGDRN